ncbi:MAG: hypothetical protein RIC36_03305 [Rhodospirillales bacterium]
MYRKFSILSATALALTLGMASAASSQDVIELTQTGCQFVEPEGTDLGHNPQQADDCRTINTESGSERLSKSETLTLKPGKYTFKVANKNVPYELGFWIRDADYDWRNPLHKVTKTSVSGGGLYEGVTKEYTVELKPGEYLYSCPLNPTPDYRIIVQ